MIASRRNLAFAASLGIAAALAGCSAAQSTESTSCTPKHQFSTITDGVLTVAVVPVPPAIDIEGGKLVGIEGETLENFAASECLTIAPQEIGGAGIIPAVQAGRVDVATGGWSPTPERKEIVGFSEYTFTDQVVILSKKGYQSLQELIDSGVTVGTPQGNRWVPDTGAALGSKQRIYQSFDETFNDLAAGRIDAVVATTASSLPFMKSEAGADVKRVVMEKDERVKASLEASTASFPLTKDNSELKSALDEFIKASRADGSLTKILEKYQMPKESAQ